MEFGSGFGGGMGIGTPGGGPITPHPGMGGSGTPPNGWGFFGHQVPSGGAQGNPYGNMQRMVGGASTNTEVNRDPYGHSSSSPTMWNGSGWVPNPNYSQTQQGAPQQGAPQQAPANSFYGNLGAYAPLPYQAFGSVPQINPALIQGGDIQGQLAPYASAVDQSLAPLFQQQSEALSSDMASRGIFNSGAANAAQGNLLAQQFGEVLGGSLPYAQQNLQGNQAATNQALAANAQAYGNVAGENMNLYNNFLNQLYGGNQARSGSMENQYLNTFMPQGYPGEGIFGQGLANAGNAYQNAYNTGMGAAGPLAGAFSNLFGSFGGGGNNNYMGQNPDQKSS